MAFADPQSIEVDGTAISMPRVSSNEVSSTYKKADLASSLKISHSQSKGRLRHMVRFDNRAVVADPLTAVNDYETLGVYLVIDEPEYGFSDADIDNIVDGFLAWFTTANIAKVLGNEH